MQRLEKEIRKKRAKLLAGLNSEQTKFFEATEELRDTIERFKSKFHVTMFPEEYDFMYDDTVDAKARYRGDNPMSESYQTKVNQRRQRLGLKPLSENGMINSDDSVRYTNKTVQRLLTAQDQALKAQIKEPSTSDSISKNSQAASTHTTTFNTWRIKEKKWPIGLGRVID
jgi:HD superfamily phosphohydrolase